MTVHPAFPFSRLTAAILAPALVLVLALQPVVAQVSLAVPNRATSVKFAVIGDNGTGDRPQYELAVQMAITHRLFPFDLVAMVGDAFYGSQGPADLEQKFARPYHSLLQAGVRFQGALGNHDRAHIVDYPLLNMQGRRYYTFTHGPAIRFFVLDTNILDPPQLRWFEAALRASDEPWKIAVFHHPIYGNARRHGAAVDLRVLLEPLLLAHGVHVVFSGHDHVYERLTPQKGILYFVTGSGGKLRKNGLARSPTTAAGFDQDQAFLIVEIDGDDMFFQAISRTGATVDSGRHSRRGLTPEPM